MSKAVLFSIRPKYCEMIISGKKTVELRKTRPKLDPPFKGYIYCTKPDKRYQTICGCMVLNSDELYRHPKDGIKHGDSIELMCCNDDYSKDNFLNGKVIGEFMCDKIMPISVYYSNPDSRIALKEFPFVCLTDKQIIDYLGNGKTGYGFHISNLVIYDKPKYIDEFEKPCSHDCAFCKYYYSGGLEEPPNCSWEDCFLTRAPQSWCYVEDFN